MTQRYYLSEPIIDNQWARLTGDEAKHLVKVMRKKVGEEVFLFDGSGTEYRSAISKIEKDFVELLIRDSRQSHLERKVPIRIATALPKGDRQKWLIEKLTELGCACVVPLNTELCVSKVDEKVQKRLQRYVIEASKQCGRAKLMEIDAPHTFEEHLQRISTELIGTNRDNSHCGKLLVHPMSDENVGQIPIAQWPSKLEKPNAIEQIEILIGPEGGFSPQEVFATLQSQWTPVDLGPRVLRTETAAIAVCAILSALVE